jgi:hypothetical protein
MTALTGSTLADVGIDAVALKPTEVDIERVHELDVETVTVDYEGQAAVPDAAVLRDLAASFDVRVTAPVRADGFDPTGDDHLRATLPESVGEVLVAGHPAYLADHEQRRAVAPRLSAAAESATDPWVGTESIERLALAVGHTQYELLAPNTVTAVRALRAAGIAESIAVYAPVVFSTDEDTILNAVGEYAARRQDVRERLPEDSPRDSAASGEARAELLRGCQAYALVGGADDVSEQVEALESAGVDQIVGYPARGLDPLV